MKLVDDLLDRADDFQRGRSWLAFLVAVSKKFSEDNAGNLAALIAYYAFVAIFPLLLVFVTLLDIAVRHDPHLRQRLITSALSAYPVIGAQIRSSVSPLHSTGLALAVGLIGALLGARGVAAAIQQALNTVWAVPLDRRPAFPWSALRSVGLVVVIGVGQMVTALLSGVAGGIGHLLPGALAAVGTIAVAFAANIGIFWLSFRLATAKEVSWRALRL